MMFSTIYFICHILLPTWTTIVLRMLVQELLHRRRWQTNRRRRLVTYFHHMRFSTAWKGITCCFKYAWWIGWGITWCFGQLPSHLWRHCRSRRTSWRRRNLDSRRTWRDFRTRVGLIRTYLRRRDTTQIGCCRCQKDRTTSRKLRGSGRRRRTTSRKLRGSGRRRTKLGSSGTQCSLFII